ncbi:alpha-N-acetylglucosaminidase [Georgenia halophila]|uniref:Alpha-N-acetylglucosaminidase n=1 Tax=Georgenia halophila TaxID=620889 RepID=A0ABP8LCJ8_9MICO
MRSAHEGPDWEPALDGLAARVIGARAADVTFEWLDGPGRRFSYSATQGQLTVRATGPGSAAVGLHDYLRRHCGTAVSWDDPRPPGPRWLPDAPPTERSAHVTETYYLNFCTFSYTSAWWDWEQWEREIDWMALHGITTPLMMVGHEAVIERVLLDEGLEPAAVSGFLSGPAYLPFLAMGNLDGFAGPLPDGWIPARRKLAGQILQRQRDLGMRPVLPAFTGHVPAELAAGRGSSREWQGHRTQVIGPEDPLFRRLAASTVHVQQELWGTDHRYASDPFIEMVPVEDDPDYPGRVAEALLAGLTDADRQAVWFLQCWPFAYQSDFWTEERVRAFLEAIPDERLVLLDLWAEEAPQWRRFDGFAGRGWMWCALLNFGGRNDPLADLPGLDQELDRALGSENPPVGIGLSMEATGTAPAYFERLLDLTWRDAPPLGDWLREWAAQRYRLPAGPVLEDATAAWHGLASTVLASGDLRIFPEDFTGLITQRPELDLFSSPNRLRHEVSELLWYKPTTLADAWRSLVAVGEAAPERAAGALGHDLAEVASAVLPRYAELCFLAAFDPASDRQDDDGARFFAVLEDLERLLGTRAELRYDTWERAAARWATSPEDERALADNARRLVTVWGDVGDGRLDDYSARLWAGLISYYRDRWRLWADAHRHTSDDGTGKHLEAALRRREHAFLRDGPAPLPAGGDVVAESRRLVDRYADAFCDEVQRFRANLPAGRAGTHPKMGTDR